jgi:hypothetical protein
VFPSVIRINTGYFCKFNSLSVMQVLNIIYVGVELLFTFNLFDAFPVRVINFSDIYLNGVSLTRLFKMTVCSVLRDRISVALQGQAKMASSQCLVSAC